MDLTISPERVYLVDDVSEIDTKFPNLSSDAIKLLLIDKAALDQNQELKDKIMPLINQSKIRAVQDDYILYELP